MSVLHVFYVLLGSCDVRLVVVAVDEFFGSIYVCTHSMTAQFSIFYSSSSVELLYSTIAFYAIVSIAYSCVIFTRTVPKNGSERGSPALRVRTAQSFRSKWLTIGTLLTILFAIKLVTVKHYTIFAFRPLKVN